MVRLGGIALLCIAFPAVAWAKPPPGTAAPIETSRSGAEKRMQRNLALGPAMSDFSMFDRIGLKTEIGRNTTLGIGMFGMKIDRGPHAPVTLREMGTPKARRAGVGFSLKF